MACYQYQNNGSCKFGENCRFSHGEGGDDYSQGRAPYAPRQYQPRSRGVCYTFQESGECGYGDNCRFAHGEDDKRAPAPSYGYQSRGPPRSRGACFAFRDGGNCQYGDDCRFSHDLSGGASTGAPRKIGGGICYKFRDEGFCQYGDDCRFSHEAIVDAGAVVDGQPVAAVEDAVAAE